MKSRKEYILCSAVYVNDGCKHPHQPKNIEYGFVVAGRRHHNCYATISILRPSIPKTLLCSDNQGYITSFDRYVNRLEAMDIAVKVGQVLECNEGDVLISEELY